MTTRFKQELDKDARLQVLRTLANETSGKSSARALIVALEDSGHPPKSEDYVKQQLRHLSEVGGVTLFESGIHLLAEITRAGLDHVARRSVLEGVGRPQPGE